MLSALSIFSAAATVLLIELGAYGAQAPVNTTACTSCNDVCSTIPPAGSTYTLCNQGSPNATRDEYNYDLDNPSDSVPVCSTCSENGFPYYYMNNLFYPDVEIWSNENPLCALVAATNIPDLVTAGSLQGWDCSGMTTTSDYCSGWTGVSCNASQPYPLNTSVTSLNLAQQGIIGTLPTQLVELYFLTSLDLSHNSLNGQLSTNFTANLLVLDISYNSFTGAIPDSIGYIYAAQRLNLASNDFSDQIPANLGLLQHAVSMNLSSNFNLVGSVPAELCADISLTYLNVGNNPSLGCYSNCLTTVNTLIVDNPANNCLNDLIDAEGAALCDLYQATNIPTLAAEGAFSGWNCTSAGIPIGDFCSWFGVACGITVPHGGSVLIDDILELNTTVVALNLPFLGLQGTLPGSMGQLSYLNVLNLEGNALHGALSPELNSYARLTTAVLNGNSFSGPLPDYPNWLSIQQIVLNNNKFTGTIPTSLGNMQMLYLLELASNNFQGEVPIQLCNDTSLNTLDFSDNPLLSCYANCLESVPNLINQQNISTCNHVQIDDVSHSTIPYLIIGGTVGLSLLVIGLTYCFARDKVVWLCGEAKQAAVRFTEHARGIVADLDFSDIRPSMLRPSVAANLHSKTTAISTKDDTDQYSTQNPIMMTPNTGTGVPGAQVVRPNRSESEARKSLEFDTTTEV